MAATPCHSSMVSYRDALESHWTSSTGPELRWTQSLRIDRAQSPSSFTLTTQDIAKAKHVNLTRLFASPPDIVQLSLLPISLITRILDFGEVSPMSWHNNAPFDPPAHLAAGLVSPQQVSSPTTTLTPDGAAGPDRKRKRTLTAQEHGDGEHTLVGGAEDGRASSSGTLAHSPGQNGNKPRHQPGVKRACNDCRQQKVSLIRGNSGPSHKKPMLTSIRDSFVAMSSLALANSINRAIAASSMASIAASMTALSDSESGQRMRRWSRSWTGASKS